MVQFSLIITIAGYPNMADELELARLDCSFIVDYTHDAERCKVTLEKYVDNIALQKYADNMEAPEARI